MTRSMTTTGIFVILASLASVVIADTPIGLQAITQFDQLATLRYGVRTYQASSRDPTGGNEDAYQYLQVIGDEQVLMDVKGPGCVYRIWMTGFESSKYIKIYLDGSSTPTVNKTMGTFFSGSSSPFLAPLVDDESVSSGGYYCYLPIPFREGCRITSTGARYYQITYQMYSSADGITTFTGSENSSTARSMWNNSGSDPKSDHGSLTATGTVSIPVGQTVTLADINSAGSIQQIEFNIPGLSAGNVTDDGRAYTGYSQFRMTVDPSNQGVRLKRRLHYAVGDQKARVTVDGVVAGEWYTPGAAESWLISTFNIPSNLTAGKSSLLIRIDFISSAMDWNEFYYWAYSIVGSSHLLTDQLNVGNSTSESSHNYTVSGQVWSGSRTLPSEWKSILPGLGLRIYWDGSGSEAVNANMCDFFGTGLGPYRVDALPVGIDGTRLYCFFPMPFSSRALVRIGNYGTMDADQITYTIRYNTLASPPSNVGRFHAKYLSQAPVTVGQDYKALDISGSGHFVGVTHTMVGPDTNRTYLEGDERIYVDGSKTPQIYGTGTEDFYNGGWYFSRGPFTLPVHGNGAHEVGTVDATSCYRFLLSDLIPFTTSLKVGFETYVSGSNYYSVAYYYLSPTTLATLTDTLDVRNTTSESAHSYSRTGETWSGTSSLRFEGDDDGVTVSDDGRRIGPGGTSQFTMAIQPTNGGVMLRRRLDYRWPRQQARIYVDGTPVGIWYDAGKNDTLCFRESEFLIPAPLTTGKSSIVLRTENISSESDWTEYRYWLYTYAPDPGIVQAPVIAEVSPDPDSAFVGTAYTRQLNLLQGTAPITWSVVSGPSGVQVSSSGYVSGWTPSSGQLGTTQTITIRATNALGYDNESWQVYVNSAPSIFATFPFASNAEGWTLEVWKSGEFENGTLVWDSASGNPGGNMKSTGSGGTNNDNSCTREGSQMTRTVSTLSYTNIQIEYDVVAALNTAPVSGCVGSCTSTVLEGSCEDKLVVYYSTTGTGGPWTLAQVLTEGVDLPTSWTHKTISLAGVSAVNNNANFALQFKWQFNTATDTGRIDNITVKGSGGPTNTAPQVNAGPDQTITLPSSANLDGTVSDDGLPNPPATVTVTWSKTSGPGTVTFGNANAVDTTASFSTSGTYVLRLTASDSVLSAYDEVTITVNPQPAPGKATNPSPSNGATGVSISATLIWTAGSGATTHKVYFGTTTSPTYQTEQSGTTFNPGTLTNGTTYYWRIDEVNAGGTTTGDLWSFTTIVADPAKASNPSPTHGATGVSVTVTLSWTAGSGATTHKVYFGTTTSPTYQIEQSGTTFNPGILANGTTYYWRIDEVNAGGTTTGDLWSFTTIVSVPGKATNPSPLNGATGVSTTATLSWTAGSGATTHKVYFGTTTSPAFQAEQSGTTFNPGTLTNGTTYYWRIDEVNTGGTTTGDLWSFTTVVSGPGKATNPSPANGSAGVSASATLSWTAGSGATSHKVYFGTSNPPDYKTQQAETTYNPGMMSRLTLYYWRIDEVNAGGTTTGDLWTFTTAATPGDFDSDGDVDLTDFGYLQGCYSGTDTPLASGCENADLDGDNDVDQADFNVFKNCLGGADRPPGC